MAVVAKRKNINRKLSPDTGKVSTDRLTKGASWSRNERMQISVSRNERTKMSVSKVLKNDSDFCTHSCPYRLADPALPSESGGSWH